MKKVKRKLSTILAADCAGFSSFMDKDEELTLEYLKLCRSIIDPIIDKYNGRIFYTAGDSVIAEFESPVNSINSAIEFQKLILEKNRTLKNNFKLVWRVGVHLDDVIIEGNNIFGTGVNIAARLETVNKEFSTEISISEEIYATLTDEFINKAKLEGEINLKGRSQKTNVYSII